MRQRAKHNMDKECYFQHDDNNLYKGFIKDAVTLSGSVYFEIESKALVFRRWVPSKDIMFLEELMGGAA